MEYDYRSQIFKLIRKIITVFSLLVIVFVVVDIALVGKPFVLDHVLGIGGVLVIQLLVFLLSKTKLNDTVKESIIISFLILFVIAALFSLLGESSKYGWPLIFMPTVVSILILETWLYMGVNIVTTITFVLLLLLKRDLFTESLEVYANVLFMITLSAFLIRNYYKFIIDILIRFTYLIYN